VRRAEAWRWGSFWRRERGEGLALLADWPLPRPGDWRDTVNQPETLAELEALRAAAQREKRFLTPFLLTPFLPGPGEAAGLG
jgi:hypothetical protein